MQGPIIDLITLALLILFFGIQQRGRRQPLFRFWFIGWLLVFLSLVVYEPAFRDRSKVALQQALQYDLLMLGAMFFLMSFVQRERRQARLALQAAAIYLPAAIGLTVVAFLSPPEGLTSILIMLGEGSAIVATLTLIPARRRFEQIAVLLLCLLGAVTLNIAAMRAPNFLPNLPIAQMLITAGVLYAGASRAPALVRLGGSIGFITWGLFYTFADAGQVLGDQRALLALGQLWNVPKFCVAFAMILEIFEASRAETARLATGYRELYDDFRLLFDHHPHPMWIHDTDSQRILSANAAAAAAYGYSMDELLTMHVAQLAAEQPARTLNSPLATHVCKDGRHVTVEVTDRAILFQGREARVLLAVDVTERERETRELERRATHDVLTGLPNRALVERRMAECLQRAALDGRKTAIVTLDLDHFKQVNDLHGHLIGDEVLRTAAQRLRTAVRQTDTVGRTGGEEFTAILCELNRSEDAARVTSLMLQAMRGPLHLSDRTLDITISIGVALFPDDATDAETLLRLSDLALYAAKHAGRNRVVFHAQLAAGVVPVAQ